MSKTRAVVFDHVVAVGLHSSPFSSPLRSLARTNITALRPSHHKAFDRSTRLAASSGPEPSKEDNLLEDFDTDKLLKDVQKRWDSVEDKTSLVVYAGGALLLLFVGSSVVSAFDRLPLLPKLFQLVGLIYTSWFVYRYLLFKSSRQELISDVEEIKKKISGGKVESKTSSLK